MQETTAEAYFVYGIRLRREREYRYVGMTTKSIGRRFSQHLKVAREGRKTPFYDWLRKQDPTAVIAEQLQDAWGLEELGQAEIDWIAYLKRDGDNLLNLSEGGLGPTGVVWTAEMRGAARIRSTGRKGVSRFGAAAPFFGHSHTEEQRRKWSKERKGCTPVQKTRTSVNMVPTTLASGVPSVKKPVPRCPQVRKGRPKPSSRWSAHTRYHTNKSVYKAECKYCVEDATTASLSSESRSKK